MSRKRMRCVCLCKHWVEECGIPRCGVSCTLHQATFFSLLDEATELQGRLGYVSRDFPVAIISLALKALTSLQLGRTIQYADFAAELFASWLYVVHSHSMQCISFVSKVLLSMPLALEAAFGRPSDTGFHSTIPFPRAVEVATSGESSGFEPVRTHAQVTFSAGSL